MTAAVFLLFACGVAREERPPSDVVAWRGYVFRSPVSTDAEDLLVSGVVTVTPAGGEPVAAEQPYPEEYPGYWSVELPAGVPVDLDIEGEGLVPSRWSADAPASDGAWSPGALFGMERAWVDSTFAQVGEAAGASVPPLDDSRAFGWAFRRDGPGGACEALTFGGAAPVCLVTDDQGELNVVTTGEWSQAFALDLPLGPVELAVDGRVLESYEARGGDVVVAGWIAGDVP